MLFKQSLLSSAQDSSSGKSFPSPDNSKNEANTVNTIGDSCLTQSESAVDHQSQACSDDYYSDDDSDNNSKDEKSECLADGRKFHSGKYEARYTWLYYSYSKAGYCCKLCEIFCPVLLHNKAPNPFVSGVMLGSHPSRKLFSHSSSKTHLAACEREGLAKSSNLKPTVYTLLTEAADKQNKEEILRNRRYFSTLVKTVFFVVQKRWALDSVSDVMDHMQAMGTDDIIQYLQYHLNLKYTSSQSVSDIVREINNVLESDLLDALRKADSYALLADESSDESHREQFAILARFKKEGIVDDFFLGIIEVKRTDAASLMAAIEEFLRAKNIDITKAAFVGFDGCNTMSGENKGLQRRFRHIVPHQLYINCRNHKLALCVKHLIKSFPVVQVVDELLIGLWKMFHYSPKKFATLQEVQTSYGLTHLKLIKACSTRWLSHGKACIRLVERFVQVLDTIDFCLDEKYEPEVHGIREQLLNKNTMATILILCDLLDPVIRFSDYLQGSLLFSDVKIRCDSLLQELHNLIERFRACMVTPDEALYLSKLTSFFEEIDDRTTLSRRLRNYQVYTQRQIIEELAVPITYGLINEITDSFTCSPVLSGFGVFNIKNVPGIMQDMALYGNTQIDALAQHYGNTREDVFQGHRNVSEPRYTEATYRSEFNNFKFQLCLLSLIRFVFSWDLEVTCFEISQEYGPFSWQNGKGDAASLFQDPVYVNSFPAMNHLVSLSELVPSSTASVERLFSLMNSLCTPSRNRLSQEKLDGLIRICLNDAPLTVCTVTRIIDRFAEKERFHCDSLWIKRSLNTLFCCV